jgi:hypothetical protein
VPQASPPGADHKGATVNLWFEAKRIWLTASLQQGR